MPAGTGTNCTEKAMPKTSLAERVLTAETRASQWLADANEARERGDVKRATECDAKSQFWLDRFNVLSGRGDRPAPKH